MQYHRSEKELEYAQRMSKQLTNQGMATLGKLIEISRLFLQDDAGNPYGYRKLSALIKQRTGVLVSKDTLQRLELGEIKHPSAATMLALASARFIVQPDGTPYSLEELFLIASENLEIDLTLYSVTDEDDD